MRGRRTRTKTIQNFKLKSFDVKDSTNLAIFRYQAFNKHGLSFDVKVGSPNRAKSRILDLVSVSKSGGN